MWSIVVMHVTVAALVLVQRPLKSLYVMSAYRVVSLNVFLVAMFLPLSMVLVVLIYVGTKCSHC